MVTAPEKVPQRPADPDVGKFNPKHVQPWTNLSVVLGLPLSLFTVLATLGLAMIGMRGDPLLGWGGVVLVWTVYVTTMVLLWAGMAKEAPAR